LAERVSRLNELHSIIKSGSAESPVAKDAAVSFLRSCNFDLGCNRYNYNIGFLLEVVAAHHMQAIESALISTHKELNKTLSILHGHKGLQPIPSGIPPLRTLHTRVNDLMGETRTISEIIKNQE